MDLLEAVYARHSVRSFKDRAIEGKVRQDLIDYIRKCSEESKLHLELVLDEPTAFDSFMAHYGKFSNVKNYIVLAGKKDTDLEEKCGYYGEKIVLFAQTLGLNTCWVALTYNKGKAAAQLQPGEKLCLVIAIGYGETDGHPHKSKSKEQVMRTDTILPEWFLKGIDAALLAPTAVNQQKFVFTLKDKNTVTAKAGIGFYSKIDLGIAKCHFELGAGRDNFRWG